ncbi:phosphatase PAP2 family protein [bacterium]|nr:phosphatase PAP2 family protein [bacterium]
MKTFLLFCLLSSIGFAQNKFDVNIFRAINNQHTPFTDDFFKTTTNSAKPLTIATPIGFVATGILAKDRQATDTGILLAASAILTAGITYTSKDIINRKRPYEALKNVHLGNYKERTASMPSGHTSAAFATATMVSLQYKKWYVTVPAYTWASLVGYSRMALGYHYPSDVIVGALVGAGSSYLIYKLQKPILKIFH